MQYFSDIHTVSGLVSDDKFKHELRDSLNDGYEILTDKYSWVMTKNDKAMPCGIVVLGKRSDTKPQPANQQVAFNNASTFPVGTLLISRERLDALVIPNNSSNNNNAEVLDAVLEAPMDVLITDDDHPY